jgi:hypothetical protein
LELQIIVYWVVQLGSVSAISAIVATLVSWFLEGRKFRREQRIGYLKERLGEFYSPFLFHFENMKSWAEWLSKPDSYAFAQDVLGRKVDDMVQIMRSRMHLASPQVTRLWFEWQPTAVPSHPSWNSNEFLVRSRRLHETVKAEWEMLLKTYRKEMGQVT